MYGGVPTTPPGAVTAGRSAGGGDPDSPGRAAIVSATPGSPSSRGSGSGRPPAPSAGSEVPADTASPRIGHAHPTVRLPDEHVVGLEVPVHHAGGVGRHQPAPGREEPLEHRPPRARPRPQPLAQGLAPDQLHRDEDLAAVLAGVVDPDHVGVLELGHRPGLAEQALPVRRVADVGAHHLDRDAAAQVGVAGLVDDPHAAGPQPPQDHVAVDPVAGRQPGRRLITRIGHQRVGPDQALGVAGHRALPRVIVSTRQGPRLARARHRDNSVRYPRGVRITVVGAGVVGLTTAVELEGRGHDVEVDRGAPRRRHHLGGRRRDLVPVPGRRLGARARLGPPDPRSAGRAGRRPDRRDRSADLLRVRRRRGPAVVGGRPRGRPGPGAGHRGAAGLAVRRAAGRTGDVPRLAGRAPAPAAAARPRRRPAPGPRRPDRRVRRPRRARARARSDGRRRARPDRRGPTRHDPDRPGVHRRAWPGADLLQHPAPRRGRARRPERAVRRRPAAAARPGGHRAGSSTGVGPGAGSPAPSSGSAPACVRSGPSPGSSATPRIRASSSTTATAAPASRSRWRAPRTSPT